jgi:hypothetical protein
MLVKQKYTENQLSEYYLNRPSRTNGIFQHATKTPPFHQQKAASRRFDVRDKSREARTCRALLAKKQRILPERTNT